MLHKLWKRLFSPSQPRKPQLKTFILEPILTPSGLLDAGDETPDLMEVELPEHLAEVPQELPEVTEMPFSMEDIAAKDIPFESGYFTVGETGEVGIDFLYDGGKYQFELGIFSLDGLDADPGSEEFIQEAAQRSLSNSELGHTVLFDKTEGAKFSGDIGEGKDWNAGEYKGIKTVQMRSGDQFGIMLVPNGTIEDVYENPNQGGTKQPLFSLSTANPDDSLHLGQIADVTGEGNTFVMEDVQFQHKWYDEDYNDLVFQIRGATGKAELLDNLIATEADWRETDLGRAIAEYAESYVIEDPLPQLPEVAEIPEIPEENQPFIGIIDSGFNENNPDIDYERIILGQDYIDGDDNPLIELEEGNEAGTHRLGIIAATQDNDIGIDGINDDAPLWVSRSDGETWGNALQEFVEQVKISEQPNAVVNISLPVGDDLTPEIENTLNEARNNGIIVIIADQGQTWPDYYDNVIVVGATGDDVTGGDIIGGSVETPVVSTVGENVGTMEDVGVATAQVTGVVSQVWGVNPQLSYQQVIDILQQTATEVEGEGVINILAAIYLAKATHPDLSDITSLVIDPPVGDGPPVGDSPIPNFLPENLVFIPDRFYNPTEEVSIFGKVRDYDGMEDLDRIDFWLQKDGGEWVNINDATEFSEDPYSDNSYRFSQNWGTLDPGNYRLKAVALDHSQVEWETGVKDFTVLSVPEGKELSDRVKVAIRRSENLHNYNPDTLSHTTDWVVSVQDGLSPQELATQFGGEFVKATGHIPNTYIWKFPQGIDPHDIAARLYHQKGIEFAYPLVNVDVKWMSPTDEPLYNQQWHLHSDSFPDAKVSNVWENQGILGDGVVVGVVDNGFEIDDPNHSLIGHPDLLPNYVKELSYDFDDFDPYPSRFLRFDYPHPQQAILDEGNTPIFFGLGNNRYHLYSYFAENSIENIWVDVDITHEALETLDVSLIYLEVDEDESPLTGQKVPLTLDENGKFSGLITDFNGKNATAKWILEVIDKNPSDNKDGRLDDFSIAFETHDTHGTMVAGVAASGDNNLGGIGVSPNANWSALRMGADGTTDLEVANVFSHQNQGIDIYNNSWGFDFFYTLDGDHTSFTPALSEYTLDKAATEGRNELGNIFVFAAGNNAQLGSDVNYNGFANSRQTIAVAAIDHTGKQAQQPTKINEITGEIEGIGVYSDDGASLLVSAYSGSVEEENGEYVGRAITTPTLYSDDGDDSNDYTNTFGGTSAAAPLVSGVVALMLEANPNLTWQDVQRILVETAQKNDPDDEDWVENGAGYWVNHKYGFGAVDAEKAVELAQNWPPQNVEKTASFEEIIAENLPDGGASLTSTIVVPPEEDLEVEWVEVVFNGEHTRLGQIEIELISPDGTTSILAQEHQNGYTNPIYQEADDTYHWVFTSARHWGESAAGDWQLKVTDKIDGKEGHWTDWTLNLYGTKPNTAPKINNLNPNETYTEDTPLTITPITITDAEGDNITVVLTLSDPNVGSLVTGVKTSESVGILTLNGTPEEVTQALGNLQFVPAPNYNGDFEITTSVTDENLATPILDKIYITGVAVNDAPTLNDIHFTGATEVQPFEMTYTELIAASGASDVEGDAISLILDTVENGTLTKDGVPVIPGETTINPGDTVVWTPDNAGDAVTAFNLSATDGEDVSDAVAVTVEVAAQPTVTINPIWLNASEDGYPAFLNITRQNGNLAEDLTVNLDISGTATPWLDYQTLPSTVTIPAGSTSVPLVIYPVDDTQYEGTETVVIGLGEGDYLGNSDSHTVTITDNDPNLPEVTLRATDAEASEDGNAAQFVVERTGDTSEALTVEYSLAGEAVNGEDYLPLTNTVTIPAGATTATIPVVPYHDYDSETEETVVINLTNAATYAVGSDNSATATIENSTRTSRYGPFVYVNPDTGNQYILSEKDTWLGAQEQAGALGGNLVTINDQAENDWLVDTFGNNHLWIGFTDSGIYGQEEGDFAWVNGESNDYTNWGAGLPNNTLYTPEGEDFAHLLSGSNGQWSDLPKQGAEFNPIHGVIEIDPNSLEQPIVNFMVTDDEAGEDGNAGQVVVTRVGDLDEDLTINYSLSGDAENGVDYQGLSETVVIPAGQSLATIPIIPVEDNLVESQETVVLNLESGNYDIGTHGTGQITLQDNNQGFEFDSFNTENIDEFNLIGDAELVDNKLRINPAEGFKTGAIWNNSKQSVNNGFETSFKFQSTDLKDGTLSGDGFAFVIQNSNELTVGSGGGNQGYGGIGGTGIANSVAIEFDTYQNGEDPNNNHISVQTNGTEYNTSDPDYSLGTATNIPDLADGNEHEVKVKYTPGNLEIFIDDFTEPALTVPVDLDTTLDLDNGKAWVGFTGATGAVWQNNDILDWSFSSQVQNTESVVYTNPETGNKYFVTANDTWLGAQEQAEAAGGNLVTINSESENQWLLDTFGNSMGRWIGITDSEIYGNREGDFQWVSGEPSSFTNWHPSEPNNVSHASAPQEGEDFTHLNHDPSQGLWNDMPYHYSSLQGIVELPADAGYNWTWTYFGEDFNPNGNDAPLTNTPNSDNARNAFLENLNNVKIEDFESYADASVPTTLNFGDETAQVSGIRSIRDFSTGGYNGDGTYPISGDNYMFHYAESDKIKIDFENPQSAFGFSTTDAGDGSSKVLVTLHREDGTTEDLVVPLGQGHSNWGEATFFGVTDTETPFTSVTLTNTNYQYDGFGVDDLIIGDLKPEVLLNTTTPPNETLHLAYHEDTPLNLSDILVTDPDGEATVKLTLSDPNAGQLTTATSGNVTSTYDAATGVWTATGAVSDLNTLLANLEFNPTANSSSNLEIASEITVGTGTPLMGTISLTGLPEKTQFFAPDTPYLSFEDSPFKDETFTAFYLEDFEDGLLNTPGVTIDNGTTHPSEHKMDSVDGDDGSIDGSGSDGRSWWSWEDSLTVTFDESVLGKLPTHVGIVKTDSVEDLQFEAFDANGNSLGVINKSGLPSILEQGVTSEDRFFGAVEKGGIASIKLTTKNFNPAVGWELDHLQYGF